MLKPKSYEREYYSEIKEIQVGFSFLFVTITVAIAIWLRFPSILWTEEFFEYLR
jgi:hypothetical protein